MLGLAVVGFIFLRHQYLTRSSFHLGRVLALEGAAFAALALLSIFSNSSVDQAYAGLDRGGVIGWGLAELLLILVGSTWQPVVATCAIILFAILGSGVPELLVRAIDRQLGQDRPDSMKNPGSDQVSPWLPAATQKTTGEPGAAPPQKREDQKQPPRVAASFKKKLQAPAARSEKPAQLPPRDERLPPLNLLIGEQNVKPDERVINQTAGLIEQTLSEFGVPAKVIGYRIGPTVTQFAVEPGFMEKPGPDGTPQLQKVRVSQISTLAKDLTLALSAERLRIEAPVPGQSFVGIEVPNSRSTVVKLRPILESEAFYKIGSPLAIAMGRDVSGQPVVADLGRMPHLLIAGTTGSGKSVCIAALTTCLVVNNTPADLRLVMIDPKMVELVRFNGIPHLYGKVETDLERILGVLRWVLVEMDHRYRLLEQYRAARYFQL